MFIDGGQWGKPEAISVGGRITANVKHAASNFTVAQKNRA